MEGNAGNQKWRKKELTTVTEIQIQKDNVWFKRKRHLFAICHDIKPSSYPHPHENCAGPFCTNPFKYRDSKSKLPLCSLHCYKAIRIKMKTEKAC